METRDAPDSFVGMAADHLPNNSNLNFDLFDELCRVEDNNNLHVDLIMEMPYGHIHVNPGPAAN